MFDDLAIQLAATRHGVTTRRELRAHGASREQLRLLWSSRQWEPASREVLVRRGSPDTTARRLCIAVLDVGPPSALGHLSGARWWGLAGCALWPLHVTTTIGSRRALPASTRLHRVRTLPAEWTTVLDGVPIARPELIALQLFAICREERAEVLVDRLWSMRLLSGPSVERFVDALGRRGRNGAAGLRRYLELRGPGYVPPDSGLEHRFARIMAEAGIPMRRQVDVGDHRRWTGRVDSHHSTLPLVVEIQSERYHRALVDRERDRVRIAALRAAGFCVVEVTDVEVWTRPQDVVARVRAAVQALSVL